jgi:hypothetical protein
MTVRREHRPTTSGISDDWQGFRVVECFDVLSGKCSGTFKIAGMSVKGPTTNLVFGPARFKSVNV